MQLFSNQACPFLFFDWQLKQFFVGLLKFPLFFVFGGPNSVGSQEVDE